MKRTLMILTTVILGSMAFAQETPRPDRQTPQERRAFTEMARRQQKIDHLEDALAAARKNLETFKSRLSDAIRAKLPAVESKVAIVLNRTGGTVIINVGKDKDCCYPRDVLLIVRRTEKSLTITGKLTVS